MKGIFCVLVLVCQSLAKEKELPQLERSPLADYLQAAAMAGQKLATALEGLQTFNPQKIVQSFWSGQQMDYQENEVMLVETKETTSDEFLGDYFTAEEKEFIKKTILKTSVKEGSSATKVSTGQHLEKAMQDHRLLQETTFDQLPIITKTLEEEYKNEQFDILNRFTFLRIRPFPYIPLGANKTCAPGMPQFNYSIAVFVCRGQRLTEVEYNNRTNKTGCYINNATIAACYCSFDFYGRYCDKFMGFTCEGKKVVDYDSTCLQNYQKQYGTKRMGYPPCRPFANGAYNFETEFNCSLYNVSKSLKAMDFMREGVKLEYLMLPEYKIVHKNYTSPSITFTYALENDKYKISKDLSFHTGISYITWNNLFDTQEDSTSFKISTLVDPITKKGDLSNLKISRQVKLDKGSKYYQYGRVPFKLYLAYSQDKKDIFVNKMPKLFIVDDMDYTLPPAVWTFPRWLIAVIVIVALLILAAGSWLIYRKLTQKPAPVKKVTS